MTLIAAVRILGPDRSLPADLERGVHDDDGLQHEGGQVRVVQRGKTQCRRYVQKYENGKIPVSGRMKLLFKLPSLLSN